MEGLMEGLQGRRTFTLKSRPALSGSRVTSRNDRIAFVVERSQCSRVEAACRSGMVNYYSREEKTLSIESFKEQEVRIRLFIYQFIFIFL